MKLNNQTKIIAKTKTACEKSVQLAIETFNRDLKKASLSTTETGIEIWLVDEEVSQEGYHIKAKENHLEIGAKDALGFVFALYAISKNILGILEFWFWNDQKISPKEFYEIPEGYDLESPKFAVRYRGWFVNDEVLLHTWMLERNKEKPWKMVFEALLRCGGNMVIPGTDKNSRLYRQLASDMGLRITHHHAEPLGAEMFARAYPDLNPSYEEHAEKFHGLWKQGIQEQKDMNVLWNIGFRGQGDCPFWVNDPKYQTPESRGELMSHLTKMQYDMVKKEDPNAVCCTNLYGETMELYQDGFFKLPDDVIKIWADNGFGKMVTRRQENHNPRIPALPADEKNEKHGIYYHVSFYDLQAANHMTMLPNSPEFVKKELLDVLAHGCNDYWLINCSNVKPHVYLLDVVSQIWKDGTVDIDAHRKEYFTKYFGKTSADKIADVWKQYADYTVPYGPNADDHAGEQFLNHPVRMFLCQYMKDKDQRAEDMLWATKEETLEKQVQWFFELCQKSSEKYETYLQACERVNTELEDKDAKCLFEDSLLLQVRMYALCLKGAVLASESILDAIKEDYPMAFYKAGKARKLYEKANGTMREREHGKWHKFYENECLTDIKQTAWVLKAYMSYVRCLDDGPHYYKWQREFLYSEEDRRVMLVMNMENHLEDDEIFGLMEEKFGR